MKKGQGLSMNVIIIAAIALVVLVVLIVLVLNSGWLLRQGTACEQSGAGVCKSGNYDQRADICNGALESYSPLDCGDGMICCQKLGRAG